MKKHNPDYILIILVFVLLIVGLIMLSSASAVVSYENFSNNYYYLKHQLIYGALIGLTLMIIVSKIDYRIWKKFAALMLFITLLLLVAVFIPGLGFEHDGARRWINVLGLSTIQPTEIVKLAFIIYLATWLEKRQKGITDWKYGFLPFAAVIGLIGLLIMMQPDLGSMSVIIFSAIIVYFVAGASYKHLLALGASGILIVLILIKLAPYRMARFTVFLNPSIDPQGIGYQINQALLAIGSGGLFGRGLGKSIQKYNYLPEATGDSIFAIISEELGFIRVLLIIFMFAYLGYRGFIISKKAPDKFGKLVATGITTWFVYQAFVNIAAMVALVPLTGIPLPFVSYGGTALLCALVGVGILINISKYTIGEQSTGKTVFLNRK